MANIDVSIDSTEIVVNVGEVTQATLDAAIAAAASVTSAEAARDAAQAFRDEASDEADRAKDEADRLALTGLDDSVFGLRLSRGDPGDFVGAGAVTAWSNAGLAWTNPGNIIADDGSNATITSTGTNQRSQLILGTMAGNALTVPAGAKFRDLKVRIEGQSSAGTDAWRNIALFPVVGGVICNQNIFDATKTFSSASASIAEWTLTAADLGFEPTPAMLNSGQFGIAAAFGRVGGSGNTLNIDYIKIEEVRFISQTWDSVNLQSCLVNFEVASGNTALGDTGTIRVACPGITPSVVLFVQGFTNRADITSSGSGGDTGGTGLQKYRLRTSGALIHAIGMYDAPTGSMYCGASVVLAGGTIGAQRRQHNDRVARGQSDANLVTASAASAEKFDISWAGGSNISPRPVVALPIEALQSHVNYQNGVDNTVTPTVDIDCGFNPDLIVIFSGRERVNTGGHEAYTGNTIGYVVPDGNGGYQQCCVAVMQAHREDGVALTAIKSRGIVSDQFGYIGGDNGNSNFPGPKNFFVQFSPITNGYRLTFTGDPSNAFGDGFCAIAMKLKRRVAIGPMKLARTAGVGPMFDPLAPVPFDPRQVLGVSSMMSALNTPFTDSNLADATQQFVFDRGNAASVGFTCKHGSTAVSSSWTDLAEVRMVNGDYATVFRAAPAGVAGGQVLGNVVTPAAADMFGIFMAFE
jgi:hypothetical protein